MSIADKITSITGHLEDDYTALEQLGVSVEDRNIENIKDMANQIYAKFPKTSYAEGSNITLSNTLKGKLDFEDGIVGIGDTKQNTTQGINMLDLSNFSTETTINGVKFTPVENGGIKINGTATANATLEFAFSLVLNGNYTMATKLDGTFTNNESPQVILRSGGSNVMYNSSMQQNVIKINTFNNINSTINKVRIVAVNGSTYNCIIYPMCLSGTYNADNLPNFEKFTGNSPSPSPSYPQDIEVVTGTQTVYIKDENNNIIDTKTINLGEYEFAKIGNYVDTIEYDVDEDKVYKNEKIGEIIFTGANDENWNLDTTKTITQVFGTAFQIPNKLVNNLEAFCNYFTPNTQGDTEKIAFGGNDALFLFLAINKTTASTVNELKTWLSTHNTKVKYVLNSPTKTEITGTLKDQIKALYYSHSFTGTTIIEIDGQLPLIIKVRALKGE